MRLCNEEGGDAAAAADGVIPTASDASVAFTVLISAMILCEEGLLREAILTDRKQLIEGRERVQWSEL